MTVGRGDFRFLADGFCRRLQASGWDGATESLRSLHAIDSLCASWEISYATKLHFLAGLESGPGLLRKGLILVGLKEKGLGLKPHLSHLVMFAA
jgi:hypothetical protein